jgi:Ca2+-binding EF-hand superfamily protein
MEKGKQKTEKQEHNLRDEEVQQCKGVFDKYKQKNDRINVWDIRAALKELEIEVVEDQLFQIFETINDKSGTIDFEQFLEVVGTQTTKKVGVTDLETRKMKFNV